MTSQSESQTKLMVKTFSIVQSVCLFSLSELIRRYAENFYLTVGHEDASARKALKAFFLLMANLDYPIMGIVKDEL